MPDLKVAEVEDMVGGRDDASAWAVAIHRRSDGGHPQLVQASIVGLAARGWDPDELSLLTLLGGGLSEIADERAATRARLIGAVPDA